MEYKLLINMIKNNPAKILGAVTGSGLGAVVGALFRHTAHHFKTEVPLRSIDITTPLCYHCLVML